MRSFIHRLIRFVLVPPLVIVVSFFAGLGTVLALLWGLLYVFIPVTLNILRFVLSVLTAVLTSANAFLQNLLWLGDQWFRTTILRSERDAHIRLLKEHRYFLGEPLSVALAVLPEPRVRDEKCGLITVEWGLAQHSATLVANSAERVVDYVPPEPPTAELESFFATYQHDLPGIKLNHIVRVAGPPSRKHQLQRNIVRWIWKFGPRHHVAVWSDGDTCSSVAFGFRSKPPAGPPRRPIVPPGHLCPEAGWWFSPTTANSRRYLAKGDVFPDVGCVSGETLWHWDPDQRVA